MTSPRGARYAEIGLRDEPVPAPPPSEPAPLSIDALRTLIRSGSTDGDPAEALRRVQTLADLEAVFPGDPWRACDLMDLICETQPRGDGTVVPCRRLSGCDAPAAPTLVQRPPSLGGESAACMFRPVSDQQVIAEYLAAWMRQHQVGPLLSWGLDVQRDTAAMNLQLSSGSLVVKWRLLDSCAPSLIGVTPSGGMPADALSANQLQELIAGMPVPTVGGPNHG